MMYVGVTAILAIAIIIVIFILRRAWLSPLPCTIASLGDMEYLVEYYIQGANHRLRRDTWMLTFIVPHLDLDKRIVTVCIGITYQRHSYPNYLGQFQQAWANTQMMLRAKERIVAAFAVRGFRANIEPRT
jgi:hypothetical protein